MAKSRGQRSLSKGYYLPEGVIRSFARRVKDPSKPFVVYERSAVIVPDFIGYEAKVYNGKIFHSFMITELHVGKKFGEFSPTRKVVQHAGKKNIGKPGMKAGGKKK